MKKFRFRLATLRKLRRARRDEVRGKLAEAYRALELLEDQIAAVGKEIINLQAAQRSVIDGEITDINGLLEAGRYQSVLRSQQSTMQGQIKLLDSEVERRRQAVVEADQQVRILDKLEERQRAKHRQTSLKEEVKELDEIASQRAEGFYTWVQ